MENACRSQLELRGLRVRTMVPSPGTPEVTVVIPTRNRAGFLPTCLKAVLEQENVALEVIVVDDASTDDTRAVLEQLQTDERVRVIGLASRGGVAAARNAGIAEARGEWLAFLDDDDIWAPWKLSRQLGAARALDADFAYGSAVVIDRDHNVVSVSPAPSAEGLRDSLLVRNVIPGGCSNVIASTRLVRELGGFDEHLAQLADRDLWIRLADAGSAAVCADVVVAYLLHPGNMRHQRRNHGIAEFEYLLEKHEATRVRYGVESSRRIGYHYFARAQLRAGHRFAAAGIFTKLALKDRAPRDLGQAVTAVVLGQGVRDTFPVLKRDRPDPDWLKARPRRELDWVHSLQDGTAPSVPSGAAATVPDVIGHVSEA
jgi:glycosyltransferase involved in cell wall biosynthesis